MERRPSSFLVPDQNDKPRAARFDAGDAKLAAKAADLMGLSIARAESSLAMALVKELPGGRIFSSGKALTPLVKWGLYEKLTRVLTPLKMSPRQSPKR